MLSPEEILAGLETIANDWRWLAIVWHGYVALIVVALLFGLRPSLRVFGLLLALPILSVSFLAWVHENPFNGSILGITAVGLIFTAARLPHQRVQIGPSWLVFIGGLIAGFGWVYPHFLNNAQPIQYLYAAPVGLVPCPTISIIIGLSLVLGGFGSRAWCLILAVVGLFYGVFGAVQLGVYIDWVLFAGALIMGYAAFFLHPQQHLKFDSR